MKKYHQLFHKLQPVLQSKQEEFLYYRYQISTDDLWDYCIEKKWRKNQVDALHLHVLVSSIFSVTASDVLHYLQVKDIRQMNQSTVNLEQLQMVLQHSREDECS